MKLANLFTLLLIMMSLLACNSDEYEKKTGKVNFVFTHHWNGVNITDSDFSDLKFTNANGDKLSIEKLRYLISDITFYRLQGDEIRIKGYQLVDMSNHESLNYLTSYEIPLEKFAYISFKFGFDEEDHIDGKYLDLNAASWNVPTILGGGYHHMQLEGKFLSASQFETGFQYHAIRAVDNSGPNLVFQETFIEPYLTIEEITNDATIEIKMNVAEWFKNPNTWNLNDLHSMMMPNYDAQIAIYENGQNAFSLGEVIQ